LPPIRQIGGTHPSLDVFAKQIEQSWGHLGYSRNLSRILFEQEPTAPTRPPLWSISATSKQTSYDFGEQRLNEFGYQLIGDGRTKDAIEVLKLNTETYPEWGNGYDSLAEAYSTAGQTELAVANYEKALKLDPKNTNAEARLKALRAPK
jgi:tetratricopeptide (TPR) repeat protein